MQMNSTYQDLVRLRADITSFSAQHPGIAMLLNQRIKEFFQRNAIRLSIIDDKYKELMDKYVEHDENGNPLKVQEEGQPARWKFRNEMDREAYSKAYNEMMATQITLSL